MVQLMEIRLRQRKKFRLIKREFDPNLAPGTEKVVQKVTRNKTITTPTTKNPLTGKSWRSEPTEK